VSGDKPPQKTQTKILKEPAGEQIMENLWPQTRGTFRKSWGGGVVNHLLEPSPRDGGGGDTHVSRPWGWLSTFPWGSCRVDLFGGFQGTLVHTEGAKKQKNRWRKGCYSNFTTVQVLTPSRPKPRKKDTGEVNILRLTPQTG